MERVYGQLLKLDSTIYDVSIVQDNKVVTYNYNWRLWPNLYLNQQLMSRTLHTLYYDSTRCM